jgi:endonuclease YncB( thermonuclease family)
LPANWQIYVRRRSWNEARMMVWAGLLLGLLAFQATRSWPAPDVIGEAPPAPVIAPPDTYAESRRSRDILTAQEGTPDRAYDGRGGGGSLRVQSPVRVIDGDTFDYGGVRVRVADIDTPEVNGRCAYESELAARATARMRMLLAAGPIELHPVSGRDEDRYGRKLRIVTRGGQSLGDVLVAEGLARTWKGRREPWC